VRMGKNLEEALGADLNGGGCKTWRLRRWQAVASGGGSVTHDVTYVVHSKQGSRGAACGLARATVTFLFFFYSKFSKWVRI
jgi:hypothetical protein